MITNVLRDRKVPIYGDGMQKRDWLHVSDHCRALWTVLHLDRQTTLQRNMLSAGELPIFDVGARCELTTLEIARRVLDSLDQSPEQWIELVNDRPNHDRRYLIDPTKIETVAGWGPLVDFDEGIHETVRWYVDHESWWRKIFDKKGDMQIRW